MRLNIHEMKQAAQLVLDWHCYYYVGLCSFASVFNRKYFCSLFFLNSLEIIMAFVEIICEKEFISKPTF